MAIQEASFLHSYKPHPATAQKKEKTNELQGSTGSMESHGKAELCKHSPPLIQGHPEILWQCKSELHFTLLTHWVGQNEIKGLQLAPYCLPSRLYATGGWVKVTLLPTRIHSVDSQIKCLIFSLCIKLNFVPAKDNHLKNCV